MGRILVVLRWIAVLPGALLAASAARVVIFFFRPVFAEGFLADWILGMMMGTGFVGALAYTGAWIAPSRKTGTALTLVFLVALVGIVILLVGLVGIVILWEERPTIERPIFLAEVLVLPVVAIAILVLAWRRRGEGASGEDEEEE